MTADPAFVASGRCKLFTECRGRCRPEHPKHESWSTPAEVPERLSQRYDERSSYTCPANSLSEPETHLVNLWADWSFYKAGGPALPGSVLDQPPWVTQGLGVLSDEQSIIVEAKVERQRRIKEMNR